MLGTAGQAVSRAQQGTDAFCYVSCYLRTVWWLIAVPYARQWRGVVVRQPFRVSCPRAVCAQAMTRHLSCMRHAKAA